MDHLKQLLCEWQEDAWGLLSVTAGPSTEGPAVANPSSGIQPPSSTLGLPSLAEMQGWEAPVKADVAKGSAKGPAEGTATPSPKPWDVAANGQEASARL